MKKHSDILQLPVYNNAVSYLGYPVVIKQENLRRDITTSLEEKGIETRSLFGCIPTQQLSYSYLKEKYEGKLPNAEYVGANGFYIGCHQYLNREDLDYIIKSFEKVINETQRTKNSK